MSLNTAAIGIHSIFESVAFGACSPWSSTLDLFIAIGTHSWATTMSLGARYAKVNLSGLGYALCVMGTLLLPQSVSLSVWQCKEMPALRWSVLCSRSVDVFSCVSENSRHRSRNWWVSKRTGSWSTWRILRGRQWLLSSLESCPLPACRRHRLIIFGGGFGYNVPETKSVLTIYYCSGSIYLWLIQKNITVAEIGICYYLLISFLWSKRTEKTALKILWNK